jgi:hypothetical protein
MAQALQRGLWGHLQQQQQPLQMLAAAHRRQNWSWKKTMMQVSG